MGVGGEGGGGWDWGSVGRVPGREFGIFVFWGPVGGCLCVRGRSRGVRGGSLGFGVGPGGAFRFGGSMGEVAGFWGPSGLFGFEGPWGEPLGSLRPFGVRMAALALRGPCGHPPPPALPPPHCRRASMRTWRWCSSWWRAELMSTRQTMRAGPRCTWLRPAATGTSLSEMGVPGGRGGGGCRPGDPIGVLRFWGHCVPGGEIQVWGL